jgi:hypothetical protein
MFFSFGPVMWLFCYFLTLKFQIAAGMVNYPSFMAGFVLFLLYPYETLTSGGVWERIL